MQEGTPTPSSVGRTAESENARLCNAQMRVVVLRGRFGLDIGSSFFTERVVRHRKEPLISRASWLSMFCFSCSEFIKSTLCHKEIPK